MLQQTKQYDRPGPRTLCGLFLLLLLGTFSLGVSVGVQVDPAPQAQNSIGLSGDAIQDPTSFRTLGLFEPVSMGSTPVLKRPLVDMVAADVRPLLITPVSHHIAVHRLVRRPAAMYESKMLVLQLAGPGLSDLRADPSSAFVTTSGFPFQYPDSALPKAKLAWMELMAEKAFRMQVLQLQAELRTELVYLRDQQANVQKTIMVQIRMDPARSIGQDPAVEQLLKDFLQKQLQLQQEYQDRIDDLQRQWLKTGRRLTIVYI